MAVTRVSTSAVLWLGEKCGYITHYYHGNQGTHRDTARLGTGIDQNVQTEWWSWELSQNYTQGEQKIRQYYSGEWTLTATLGPDMKDQVTRLHLLKFIHIYY